MDNLESHSPCAELLPLTIGGATLSEVDLGPITCVMPLRGQHDAVSNILKDSCGMVLPPANQSCARNGTRLIWFGREAYLLAGSLPGIDLATHAAVSDQSDAWACVELSGAGVETVLARLVPIDLRVAHFALDATARTLVGHMNAAMIRTSGDRILIMVFRSMASTLVEEIKEAMEAVAARG